MALSLFLLHTCPAPFGVSGPSGSHAWHAVSNSTSGNVCGEMVSGHEIHHLRLHNALTELILLFFKDCRGKEGHKLPAVLFLLN